VRPRHLDRNALPHARPEMACRYRTGRVALREIARLKIVPHAREEGKRPPATAMTRWPAARITLRQGARGSCTKPGSSNEAPPNLASRIRHKSGHAALRTGGVKSWECWDEYPASQSCLSVSACGVCCICPAGNADASGAIAKLPGTARHDFFLCR
jgi:hypothetical protein